MRTNLSYNVACPPGNYEKNVFDNGKYLAEAIEGSMFVMKRVNGRWRQVRLQSLCAYLEDWNTLSPEEEMEAYRGRLQ